jgi:hypothetical protein
VCGIGRRRFGFGLLALLASACATPTPEATPTLAAIFAPQPSASSSPIVSPTQVALATVTPPPRPTAATQCDDDAAFIEDLTIPDGSQVLPGQALDKRWSISNSGSCDWGPDYRLVQVGTSEIEGPGEVALFPASAGSTAVWEVALVAPSTPGEYLGRWQARAPDGSLFGDEVFVLIVVAEPEPTATPTVTPTP